MERPNYIPLEKEVRDLIKSVKGVETYSGFLKKAVESYAVNKQALMKRCVEIE